MRSWIVITITLYFICTALSIFFFNGEHWYVYFWAIALGFPIFNLAYNLKEDKTNVEMVFICVDGMFRIFVFAYMIIGLIFNQTEWMNQNIFCLCSMAISALIGTIIWHKRYYGKIY